MKLTEDKKGLSIKLDRTLTAKNLDALISRLGILRSSMTPPVPLTIADIGPDGPSTSENNPSVIATGLPDGRLRLWIRSDSLGWLVFNFDPEIATALQLELTEINGARG
ncbi:hypothetical protein PSQ39_21350 [Curvibacter sp. HBC28]|uniref:DUF4340 domain-containing protein n=1 Tax=Curvibacter microcysteis TaxID=3026419 RepID=A0ABT5MLC8_9BURK|nr:hypothetical protein [Curvibacter sp. HBC28]MDD0817195.1 hypothetical protein [Curvibacter sp. HBC28]